MLLPKRVKFRKSQRGKRRGKAYSGYKVTFGEYGLQAAENAWLTNAQIEAARVSLSRHVKKGGKIWIRVFPDKAVTKKPAETRMGKGKGDVTHWVFVVHRGRVLFEMQGIPEELAREAMRLAAHKIPFRTKFVSRKGTL
ncbi:MAG: 50S ribosomal protein L16 [Candidatus Omnitrophota bacterium]